MTRIAIDLNVRVRGNLTYSGFEDIEGDLPLDGWVEVYEPESDIVGWGRVVEIDEDTRLVYLEIEWAALRPRGSVAGSSVQVLVTAGRALTRTVATSNLAAAGAEAVRRTGFRPPDSTPASARE